MSRQHRQKCPPPPPPPPHQPSAHLKCQASDDNDFTMVTATTSMAIDNYANKENCKEQAPTNYRTISAVVMEQRRLAKRMVETERAIFLLAFHLIEAYYRPLDHSNDKHGEEPLAEGRAYKLPRKRVHGLTKAYLAEYDRKAAKEGNLKCSFHRDTIDWQLVFAPVTGHPARKNNLAKELNFDQLFDYEDVIATTSILLANARQHSDLIDGLSLCREVEKTSGAKTLADYDPKAITGGCGGAKNFEALLNKVRQLVDMKRAQVKEALKSSNKSSGLLTGWFADNHKKVEMDDADQDKSDEPVNVPGTKLLINAWEEFIDIVEILKF